MINPYPANVEKMLNS